MQSYFSQIMKRFLHVLITMVLCAPVAGWSGLLTRDKPYEESNKEKTWSIAARPKKDTAAEQFAYCRELKDNRKYKAAIKQCRALVKRWPASPEAAEAQMMLGWVYEKKGTTGKAFDAYQELIEEYAGRFPYEDILERQFQLAVARMQRKKARWFFGGFEAPDEAVELLEKILENAPEWHRAPQVQFLIGKAYEMSGQLEMAITPYMTVQLHYPRSTQAEEAAFRRAYCLFKLSHKTPNNELLLNESWSAVILFLRAYPESKHVETARIYKHEILNIRAHRAYEKAVFYEKMARKPKAALMAYRLFVKEYPNSEWTDRVKKRIKELEEITGQQNKDLGNDNEE